MTPGFDNPTVRDNTDPIRNANGAKTMGDHAQDTLFALGLWGSYQGSFPGSSAAVGSASTSDGLTGPRAIGRPCVYPTERVSPLRPNMRVEALWKMADKPQCTSACCGRREVRIAGV